MEKVEEKNAIIESATITSELGLSAWIHLDYGDGGAQGFGGYLLYAPKGWSGHKSGGNYAGHFIYRVMQIAGVETWSDLIGKTVRVRATMSRVSAIGHITKNDWFDPKKEFAELSCGQR